MFFGLFGKKRPKYEEETVRGQETESRETQSVVPAQEAASPTVLIPEKEPELPKDTSGEVADQQQQDCQYQQQEQKPQEQKLQEQKLQEQTPQEQKTQEQKPQEQKTQEQTPQEQKTQEQTPQEQRTKEQKTQEQDQSEKPVLEKAQQVDLRPLIEHLKTSMGDALQSASIVSYKEYQSIASYNPKNKLDALITNYVSKITETLKSTGFGILGDYVAVNLKDEIMLLVLPSASYCWVITFDTKIISFGTFTAVLLPTCIEEMRSVD